MNHKKHKVHHTFTKENLIEFKYLIEFKLYCFHHINPADPLTIHSNYIYMSPSTLSQTRNKYNRFVLSKASS